MGIVRGASNTFNNFCTIGLNRASIAIYLAAHKRQKGTLRRTTKPVELDNKGTILGSTQDYPILALMRQRLGIKSISLQDPSWFRLREIAKISKDLRILRKTTDSESLPIHKLKALRIEQIDPLLPQAKEVSPLLARAWEMRTMFKSMAIIAPLVALINFIAGIVTLGIIFSLGPSFEQSILNFIKKEDQVDYLHATTLRRKFQYIKLIFKNWRNK